MYWVGLLLHSAVILLAANLLGRFPRNSSPAYRHRIVLAGFELLLLWPLFSALAPQIQLPLWTYWHASDSVTVQQTTVLLQRGTPASNVISWPAAIWITGVLFSVVPAILGYFHMLRTLRRATPLSDDLLGKLCAELGIVKKPALLTVPGPFMPLTFGLLRPRILLPAEYTTWTALRQRSVLLHELAHVQRRDILSQLFANAITALWWFQPLCWINYWTLRRESERACDALVLASGVRPSDYATQLLEIAQDFSGGRSWSSAAITMARRNQLETRLRAILDPRLNTKAKDLSFAAMAALTLWSMAASAITLTPQQTNSPGGIFMKRTFLSGLLSSVGLSAATIGGSLFDPSGAAVSQAKASLYNPETKATAETTTASDGKFVFDNLPAGPYILRVEKPGFASLFREFNVQTDSKLERGLTLKLGANQETGNAQVAKGERDAYPQSLDPHQLRIGGAVAQSNLVTKVQPIYPVSAKTAGTQGTVSLDMVISKEGVPEELRVVSSPSDDLTQSALEAVQQWRYRPTLLNGAPVEVVTNVVVNYTLSR